MRQRSYGFTIVELLIVIAVIGILAAITIVSYTGIQERARNTLRIQTAKQAMSALQLVKMYNSDTAIRDSLHQDGGWWYACVGTGYEDFDGDGLGDCGVHDGWPFMSESSAFNDLLAENTNLVVSTAKFPVIATDSASLYGPFVNSGWVDESSQWVMEYSLEGEGQECSLTPLVYRSPPPAESWNLTTTPPATDAGWSGVRDGVTECIVLIR